MVYIPYTIYLYITHQASRLYFWLVDYISRQQGRGRRKQAAAGYLDWSWNGEEEAGSREEGGGSSKQAAHCLDWSWNGEEEAGSGRGRRKQQTSSKQHEQEQQLSS
jgi:hypothetical protein